MSIRSGLHTSNELSVKESGKAPRVNKYFFVSYYFIATTLSSLSMINLIMRKSVILDIITKLLPPGIYYWVYYYQQQTKLSYTMPPAYLPLRFLVTQFSKLDTCICRVELLRYMPAMVDGKVSLDRQHIRMC